MTKAASEPVRGRQQVTYAAVSHGLRTLQSLHRLDRRRALLDLAPADRQRRQGFLDPAHFM
jgi:hypothetical protein